MSEGEGHQMQLEQRQQTECPECGTRPVGENYVYVRTIINGGAYYPKQYRCDECVLCAHDMANSNWIKGGLDRLIANSRDMDPYGRDIAAYNHDVIRPQFQAIHDRAARGRERK